MEDTPCPRYSHKQAGDQSNKKWDEFDFLILQSSPCKLLYKNLKVIAMLYNDQRSVSLDLKNLSLLFHEREQMKVSGKVEDVPGKVDSQKRTTPRAMKEGMSR